MESRIHDFVEFKDLNDMIKKSKEMFGKRPAFKFKTEKEGEFRVITYTEFANEIDALGTKLIDMGLKNVKSDEKDGYYIVKYDLKNSTIEIYNTEGFDDEGNVVYSLTDIKQVRLK